MTYSPIITLTDPKIFFSCKRRSFTCELSCASGSLGEKVPVLFLTRPWDQSPERTSLSENQHRFLSVNLKAFHMRTFFLKTNKKISMQLHTNKFWKTPVLTNLKLVQVFKPSSTAFLNWTQYTHVTSQWEQEKSLTKSTSGSISSGRGVEYQSVGLTPPSSTSPETKANLLTNSVWSGSGLGSCGSVTSSVNNKSLTSDATIPVHSKPLLPRNAHFSFSRLLSFVCLFGFFFSQPFSHVWLLLWHLRN